MKSHSVFPQYNKMNKFPKTYLPLLLFLLFISFSSLPAVKSQPSNNNNDDNEYPYQNFNPSIAIIIVVVVSALFFMGFFSIYLRHCAEDNSGGTTRNLLSINAARRANGGPRGIEESVLGTFPTFSYAEVKHHQVGKGALECAVCLNEFQDDETLRLIPKCDHVFHAECIDAWLQGHVTCPVCRADLAPKPGEESYHVPEMNQEVTESNDEPERNDDVMVQIDLQETTGEVKPEMNRNLSFGYINRPPRAESVRGRKGNGFGFRSHSTGHSLVLPGENLDRFTLRLPHQIRKEIMNRALLNRTKSFAKGDGSIRRGTRAGCADGSSRGGRSFPRMERSDRAARSDRWLFSKAAPFFSRTLSVKSPVVAAANSEGSTSEGIKTAVRMPSFKCLEPKSLDETGLIKAGSAVRPPV